MASDKPAFVPPELWSPSTPEVTTAMIDQVLAQYDAVAVHFWAVWNRVDRMMDESIQAVAPEFGERLHFVSCNIDLDENRELCEQCNVVNIPFLAVFIDCHQRRPILGFRSPDDLKKELHARLKDENADKKWWQF